MNQRLPLPALRGDDSLGFLAALGLLSLSEQGEIGPLRLGWEGFGAPVAFVEGPASIEALSDELRAAFKRLQQSGGVLPGVPPDFPLPSPGTDSDHMRMKREPFAEIYRRFDHSWIAEGHRWAARWLIAIAAQISMKVPSSGSASDREKRAFVELTPFYAPTGQMKLRSSIFEFTMKEVKSVDGPGDAVTHWTRSRGYAAANFDGRALRDGSITTTGGSENQGAPSPTWLATMAIRYFPLVDKSREAGVVAWQRFALYPGYTQRSLVWPVWRPALDPPAVRALLAHPALATAERGRYDVVARRPRELEALDVSGLFGASRRTLSQGDGPLGPTIRIWPET